MPGNPRVDKPRFNSKYIEEDKNLYINSSRHEDDNEQRQRHYSQSSASSTSPNTTRNSSHGMNLSLIEGKLGLKGLSGHNASHNHENFRSSDNGVEKEDRSSIGSFSMGASKSFSGFLSSKHNSIPSQSSSSSKKSGKRNIFNRLLTTRKGSETSPHGEYTGRHFSTSSKKSTSSNSPGLSPTMPLHQHKNSDASHYSHFPPLDQPNTSYIRGRLPSEQNIPHVQPLSKYRSSFSAVPTLHHDAHPSRKSQMIDTNLDQDIMSTPMNSTNSLAQSYGISLIDEDSSNDMNSISNSAVGMSRVASTNSTIANNNHEDLKSFWKPPDSWKVTSDTHEQSDEHVSSIGAKNRNGNESDTSSDISLNSLASPDTTVIESDSNKFKAPKDKLLTTSSSSPNLNNAIKNANKKIIKGSSRSSVRIFKGDKSSLIPCTTETTCENIMNALRRKRFLKQDDDHMLVLKCGGLTRILSYDERPLRIQRKMLFLYGYTERDNLDYIERTDLSFLFKFVVEEKGIEVISEEKRRLINPHNVNLDNWNLQDIPNFLFAEPIVTLEVSQNPSLLFARDFMHDSKNMTSLSFTRSGSPVFPPAIVDIPRLLNLNLEVNYIRMVPDDIAKLSTLISLNLACNRLTTLPDSFGDLKHLQFLNLGSNRLKKIPEPIYKLENLKQLDLSYNSIAEFSDQIAKLSDLEGLVVAGNRFTGDLPEFFDQFKNLLKIDIRFNKFSSIDSLKRSPKLEVIRATGNNISVFRSRARNLFEVELNINPLTYVYFEIDMENLKIVDFSKGKLTSCTFTQKLVAVEKLNLDSNHLSILPDHLDKMKNLHTLSISRNNLTNLPDSLCMLKRLQNLDLHLNNIGKINPNIWNLGSLEVINLASNLLKSFPEPPESFINNFNNQKVLRMLKSKKHVQNQKQIDGEIDDHAIEESGSSAVSGEEEEEEEAHNTVAKLPNVRPTSPNNRRLSGSVSFPVLDKEHSLASSLKKLCLVDNKFSDTIFPTISVFQNLRCLNLSYNEIYEIPAGFICKLKQLKKLFLSGNYLSSLPVEDLDELENIETLHLNGNRFGTLPAELSKLCKLKELDVGSNQLKYNIGNIPYDWNWCYNKNLRYLNFSGNKRLEIKAQQNIDEETGETLDSFLSLKDLMTLGLIDVTITTDAVPDQSVDTRIRSTVSQLGKFGYGISDSLGGSDTLTTRDAVIEKFRGNPDEFLITIYDGKNSLQRGGDKISKIIQETFEIHLAEELESLGKNVIPGIDSPKNVEDCLRNAFIRMNTEMCISINKDELSTFSSAAVHRTKTMDKLTYDEDGLSGCSATIIYIKKDYVYVANVGDIMCILTRSDGEFSMITTKHEPYAPKEYDRIRDSGGYVTTDGLLDGVSDVSRAVGFFKLIPHINAKPSISKFKLTQNEEMIAVCTSEVWKQVSFELAADIIRQEKSNPLGAAEKLRDFAISYGSVNKKVTAAVLSLRQFTSKQKHYGGSKPVEDSTLRKLDDEIEPPTGYIAMVFTDIKNSTLLWDSYPVAMRSAIKVHNAIMRRQLRIIGGYEVKTEGDAFIVSFPTPTAALLWCFAVQTQLLTTSEWPAEILTSDQGFEIKDNEGNLIFRGLSVRMGIHWGRPVCEMDVVTKRMDYFGPMVNRASRVSAVADGGQITMSNDYRHELEKVTKIHEMIKEGKVKDINGAYGYKSRGQDVENQMEQLDKIGIVIESLGARKLKGLETPENIWLVFPKPLSSRLKMITNKDGEINNKSNKLAIGGITVETAWILRKIALRLERVISFTVSNSLGQNIQFQHFSDGIQEEAENKMEKKLANVESFMMLFLDHTITRIENCVTVLGTHMVLADSGINSNGISMIDTIKSMATELKELKAQVHEYQTHKQTLQLPPSSTCPFTSDSSSPSSE
ncbi:hypothetical protein CAS74_000322 [Pichia kudriavzevii]|uniref:Adenylate cyclase n=1 Tax=Pichia kudriavzevii TaxID=4909 RepID=A0A1Z8JTQ6_PICKU|nr:hypothetical protein CAS74_000322 [Pichia kudriavzevii]